MTSKGLACGVALVVLGQTAVAQQAVIDRCKQTSSDADRIACLEAALLGKELVTTEEPSAQIDTPGMESGVDPRIEATPVATPVAAAVPAAAAPIEKSQEQAAAPSSAKVEEAQDPSAEPASAPVGIGAEQVIARNQSEDGDARELDIVRNLRVASYDKVPYERLVVRLENGQVWRQIKGDTQRIKVDLKRNQTVDISEASMSGYKLRLNEIRRTIRVERVK